jgi:hypothetical protein
VGREFGSGHDIGGLGVPIRNHVRLRHGRGEPCCGGNEERRPTVSFGVTHDDFSFEVS